MSIATPIAELPTPIAETILGSMMCEFATLTKAGVPLDTPMLYSVEPDGATVDVSTGVSYPAKAERARRNSKIGLLIEAPDRGPVVSISGLAGVRDADIQANALRYAHDFRH
jgi:general stress protein 26